MNDTFHSGANSIATIVNITLAHSQNQKTKIHLTNIKNAVFVWCDYGNLNIKSVFQC